MPFVASSRPPAGFVTVQEALDAPQHTEVNLIGVVEHFMDIKPTAGTDLQFTMSIQDQSVTSSLSVGMSLKVKFFMKSPDEAPKIESAGDTVILRRLKMSKFREQPIAMFRPWSECTVYASSSMPDPHFNDSYASGGALQPAYSSSNARPAMGAQQLYAISLRHVLRPDPFQEMQKGPEARKGVVRDKFALIRNIGPQQFFDLAVEVVKKISTGNSCEIYVTDYTENSLLYHYNHPDEDLDLATERDGDAFSYTVQRNRRWPGPFGQMTLQVKLWEPHSSHALSHIREGDFVFIRNVHVKMDRSGGKIEGALHQDMRYPLRIDINKLRPQDGRIMELERRKQQYINRQNGAKPSKRKEKRRKEKMKKAGKLKEMESVLSSEEQISEGEHAVANSHVKCERHQDPVTSLMDIENHSHRQFKTPSGIDYNLPFVNAKYRARVRVVDFWPQKLEDFSKSLDDAGYNDVDHGTETQSSTSYTALSLTPKRWEWHFYLLVEDAKHVAGQGERLRIPLLVHDQDAEYLLNLTAQDLRNDKKTLAQLREKLFIMWGNLEELKSSGQDPLKESVREKHSSNPLDCCVKETGVQVESQSVSDVTIDGFGWHRVYRLYGTTIHG